MIRVVRGDLAAAGVECVLRPVRSDGASVSAASRRVETGAGEAVLRRVASLGEAPVGTALLTPGGELPCDFIVHVVLQSPEEPVSLGGVRRGLVNALRRARDVGLDSVALPPLGMMAGALDADEVARVVAGVLRDHLAESHPPRTFRIVVESEYEEAVFSRAVDGGAGEGT